MNRAVATENIAMEVEETEPLELRLSDTLCSRHPIQAIISDLVGYSLMGFASTGSGAVSYLKTDREI